MSAFGGGCLVIDECKNLVGFLCKEDNSLRHVVSKLFVDCHHQYGVFSVLVRCSRPIASYRALLSEDHFDKTQVHDIF